MAPSPTLLLRPCGVGGGRVSWGRSLCSSRFLLRPAAPVERMAPSTTLLLRRCELCGSRVCRITRMPCSPRSRVTGMPSSTWFVGQQTPSLSLDRGYRSCSRRIFGQDTRGRSPAKWNAWNGRFWNRRLTNRTDKNFVRATTRADSGVCLTDCPRGGSGGGGGDGASRNFNDGSLGSTVSLLRAIYGSVEGRHAGHEVESELITRQTDEREIWHGIRSNAAK